MIFVVDTNAWAESMRRRGSESVKAHLAQLSPGDAVMNAVIKAELLVGALKSSDPPHHLRMLMPLFELYESLPIDDAAAEHYAHIRAALEANGRPIGDNDLLIAASARSRNLTLVTHNLTDFHRVPGLKVVDWQEPTHR